MFVTVSPVIMTHGRCRERHSYRWGYLVLSFGILVLVGYRSFVLEQANWDLLALVIVGGMAPNVYQGANHVLSRRWLRTTVVTMVAAAIVAVAVVLLGR